MTDDTEETEETEEPRKPLHVDPPADLEEIARVNIPAQLVPGKNTEGAAQALIEQVNRKPES